MSHELQRRFHDPLLQPIGSISPSASAASRFSGKFRKTKKELLHDGPPSKSSLRGRQEVHHEILYAVIHEK
jgi:hypothetical protein